VNQTDGGSRSQLLDVTECRFGLDLSGEPYRSCSEWVETWVERPTPTSTVLVGAGVAVQTTVDEAGIYTFTFPQVAPPVTVTAPPTTITNAARQNADGEVDVVVIDVVPETVYTIPGPPWNAFVTQSFAAATTVTLDVYVTSVVTVNVPHITQPAGR
jgi:hypothetical protein